jgi:DUF4097 and DUF4098 domain-containing protein YvlB
MTTFPTPVPPRLVIQFGAGTVAIDTSERTDTEVVLTPGGGAEAKKLAAATVIDQRGDEIVVAVPKHGGSWLGRTPQLHLVVRAPHDTGLSVSTASADVEARGRFSTTTGDSGSGAIMIGDVIGDARVKTGSGDIEVDLVDGDLDARSGSGDVRIGRVTGSASAKTGSGDVAVGEGGRSLTAKTGSGDVSIEAAAEEIGVRTGSGNVHLTCVRRGEVQVTAASGDIRLGVADGTAAWLDVRSLTGRVDNDLDAADAPGETDERVRLRLETVSGSIDLYRSVAL